VARLRLEGGPTSELAGGWEPAGRAFGRYSRCMRRRGTRLAGKHARSLPDIIGALRRPDTSVETDEHRAWVDAGAEGPQGATSGALYSRAWRLIVPGLDSAMTRWPRPRRWPSGSRPAAPSRPAPPSRRGRRLPRRGERGARSTARSRSTGRRCDAIGTFTALPACVARHTCRRRAGTRRQAIRSPVRPERRRAQRAGVEGRAAQEESPRAGRQRAPQQLKASRRRQAARRRAAAAAAALTLPGTPGPTSAAAARGRARTRPRSTPGGRRSP
jgi:hypothetical protein